MDIEITCPGCGCKFTGLGYLQDNVLYCCEACANGADCECEGCACDEDDQRLTVVGS